MLIRLLRTYLRPYRGAITAVCVLQLVQTLATLYLPTLNADIIDNGVITGNTGYIMRTGGIMLVVSLVQIICAIGAVYFGARTAMALGRDVRHGVFRRVQAFSAREVGRFGTPSLITRTTNDVQQVQMLAVMTFTLLVSAPIMCVGGVILALNQDVPLSSLLLVAVPVLGIIVGLIIRRMRPLFRLMQDAHRRHQPGAPRADHRGTGHPGLRPRPAGARPVRRRERRALRRLAGRRPPDGAHVPVGDAGPQRVQHRGAVVRRPPGRQRQHADRRADRVPQLPAADPDVGHDGHVRVHDGPAGGGVRRADHGGARHRAGPRPAEPPRSPSWTGTATSSCATRSSATPVRRSRCCPASAWTARPGEVTAIIGGTGSGKTDAAQPHPAADGRHRREPSSSTAPTSASSARRCCRADRAGAAEAVPVLRDRGDQPALRQPGRHRR